MAVFNPYLVDEIVNQSTPSNSSFGNGSDVFGLIDRTENDRTELHGFEITMSGKLVLPELKQQPEREEQKLMQTNLC